MSRPVRYGNARVYAPGAPTAVVVVDGVIGYLGNDLGAEAIAPDAVVLNCAGRLLAPAFVDAHLHAVQTGQKLAGVDLSEADSREAVLAAVEEYLRGHPATTVVFGHGWDERHWPDPRPPHRQELDRACGPIPVYLARVDVHSAVVSTALLDRLPDVATLRGFGADGLVSRDAHHACRGGLAGLSTDADRRTAARAALVRAAQAGIAAVHELGGPHLGPLEDLIRVREAAEDLGLEMVGYWGELASHEVIDRARAVGAAGLAGDLCVDGAIGSRTAALQQPYADAPSRGVRYLAEDEIADHVVQCTRTRLQAGFHCIGDDAVAATVAGLRRAAEVVGVDAIRAARHRLEHLEMLAEGDLATLAELHVVASMQPAFDAAWGGPNELYEQRLGRDRAAGMNRLGTLSRRGVRLAFGSDSPVTPLAGWETVRAAVHHSQPAERLSVPAAFAAATRGGWYAARRDDCGDLTVGSPATFAVWDLAGVPLAESGLPRLAAADALPHCAELVVRGRTVHRVDADPVG